MLERDEQHGLGVEVLQLRRQGAGERGGVGEDAASTGYSGYVLGLAAAQGGASGLRRHDGGELEVRHLAEEQRVQQALKLGAVPGDDGGGLRHHSHLLAQQAGGGGDVAPFERAQRVHAAAQGLRVARAWRARASARARAARPSRPRAARTRRPRSAGRR